MEEKKTAALLENCEYFFKWTAISVAFPLLLGTALCVIINFIF